VQNYSSNFLSYRAVRSFIVVVAIGICASIIWLAGGFAFSRLFTRYSLMQRSLPAAERAVELAPLDADAHVARAALLSFSGPASQSAAELEQAIALRPAHYYLWLNLGMLRDQAGDSEGALSAFDESIRLAPFYALPRWQRGNLLVRMGRYDEAFADLNQAARSDPELIPSLIDLAWGISKGNISLTEQLARINTGVMHTAFARLLARQGKAQEALAQFQAAGSVKAEVRKELVEQLVAKKAFREAFEIWKGNAGSPGNEHASPSIYDGGFEGPLSFDEGGFGWNLPRDLQAISMSLDSSQPNSGSKSLRIEFGGDSNAGSPLLSQLILVEPSQRYRINFGARSQDIVTGGLPIAIVHDTSGDLKPLGRSLPLSSGSTDWRVVSFEFTTRATTSAVVLSLQREACTTAPCPIFGSISLDSFSMEQLK
jgi:tetratricopeptide (TPR) repeat protein